jgi:acetyltransferase-like isoleucine patch superfamily enzyme
LPAALTVNHRLLELLKARRIYHRFGGGERLRPGDGLFASEACELEPYVHVLAGEALPERMGAFSYATSPLLASTRIGRYCSIAAGVEFIESQHPAHWASTSPFSYSPYGLEGFRSYLVEERKLTSYPLHGALEFQSGPVTLGNDVWVGQRAMFMGGISVGDGAVVAAGAVVTRDVPPYAIVGGVPARTLRMRFADPVVERMLALQWWRFGPDVLQPLDVRDVEGFLDRLEARLAVDPPPLLGWPPLTFAEMREAAAT